MKMINVFGSNVGQEELDEIKSCFDDQWLGIGKKVQTFEEQLAKFTGMSDVVLVDSGSNALYIAIEALNLPPHSEIILPAVTWISCATSIELAGHTPVFADVSYNTINIDLDSINNVMSNKTAAIMIVHYAGLPVICPEIHLPIISDCAHAINTFYKGKHIGSMYGISTFSFDSVKNIACGELGGVTSPSPTLISEVRNLRYCGIRKSGFESSGTKERWWEYELKKAFPKMMPNDISASIGISQLRRLDSLQIRRKEIWDIYQRELANVDWIITPPNVPSYVQHSYFTYFIKVINERRDELAKYLLDNGIYTTVRYHPLHMISNYHKGYRLPMAEKINEQLLNIPLHPSLSDTDVEYIIEKIKKFK